MGNKWKIWWERPRNKKDSDCRITLDDDWGCMEEICIVLGGEDTEDIAKLITGLHNAAVKINPSNPMAIAENLEELVQISERLIEGSSLTPANGEGNLILRMRYQSFQDLCTTLAALKKAKGE